MSKLITPLAAAAAVLLTLAATAMTSRAAGSYADDRSEIEDLQARYLFALDFGINSLVQWIFRRFGAA